MTSRFASTRKHYLSLLVLFCLGCGILAWTAGQIDEYNRDVELTQSERQMDADYGAHFAVDAGPDYRPSYRTYLMLIACLSFLIVVFLKRPLLSLVSYSVSIPIMCDWIWRTARDLSYAPYYMIDSPYLLRLASIFDWVFFAVLAVTILVMLSVAVWTLMTTVRTFIAAK